MERGSFCGIANWSVSEVDGEAKLRWFVVGWGRLRTERLGMGELAGKERRWV